MEDGIRKRMKAIASEKNIIIICIVECGSRAYRLHSDSSDYDLRMIYIQKDEEVYYEKYLEPSARRDRLNGGLHECEDVDERTLTGEWKTKRKGTTVDWHGWDITKAVRHLHEMNPSIVEWVFSPIVYYDNPKYGFLARAQQLLLAQHRTLPLVNHYKSMATRYYDDYIFDETQVRIKKYMTCVRCCVMVEWLLRNQTQRWHPILQVDFEQVMDDLDPFMSENLLNSIYALINKKRNSEKYTYGYSKPVLNRFIEKVINKEFVSGNNNAHPSLKAYNKMLDSAFIKTFENLSL